MIVKGAVKISDDGKTWKTAGAFEFGNLKNDPEPAATFISRKR